MAAAVVLGATLYAQSLPNSYDGRTILAFAPRMAADGEPVDVGADTLRVLLPKYVAYVSSRATVRRVADRIGEVPGDLVSAVDATITEDSGNITITVTLPSARRAASAANALADETLAFNGTDPLLQGVTVAPALPPTSPSGPPRTLILLASLVVGLTLGVAAAFVLERGRPRVRTWRDAGLVTGYPVVGRIPSSRALRSAPIEALSDPAVGAAVRTLRTNLERVSQEKPVHALVVTSSLAGEGKTTVALTLAMALARLDAEVLLVDGDLRRPGLTGIFDLHGAPGLNGVLRQDIPFGLAVRAGPAPRLHLLPTQADIEAGDLLARHFADVLREARSRFDVIVIDAPPLLGGDDARTVATLCDGVVVVVAADTPVSSVSEGAAALDALGVRVLGVVANRARDPRGLGTYGSYGMYGTDRA